MNVEDCGMVKVPVLEFPLLPLKWTAGASSYPLESFAWTMRETGEMKVR